METLDHATGPEKLELLAKQQGNDVSIALIKLYLEPMAPGSNSIPQ